MEIASVLSFIQELCLTTKAYERMVLLVLEEGFAQMNRRWKHANGPSSVRGDRAPGGYSDGRVPAAFFFLCLYLYLPAMCRLDPKQGLPSGEWSSELVKCEGDARV
jgi:hypothetical protein